MPRATAGGPQSSYEGFATLVGLAAGAYVGWRALPVGETEWIAIVIGIVAAILTRQFLLVPVIRSVLSFAIKWGLILAVVLGGLWLLSQPGVLN